MDERSPIDAGMYITNGCLIVPIQAELNDDMAIDLQSRILKRIEDTGVKGVVIDLSGVDVMDSFLTNTVLDTARMARLLGARTAISGLRAGAVASIVTLGIDFKDILISSKLEDGIQKVMPRPLDGNDGANETKCEPGPESENDGGDEFEGKGDRSKEHG